MAYEAWKLTRSTWRIWTNDRELAKKLRRRKRVEQVAEERSPDPRYKLVSWETGLPYAWYFDVPAGYHRPIIKFCEKYVEDHNQGKDEPDEV